MTDERPAGLNLQNIHFPLGLEGLPEWDYFDLAQGEDMEPVALLRSRHDPEVSLIVADPRLWLPRYRVALEDDDLVFLQSARQQDLLTLAIINVEPDPFAITANLMAPLVINPRQKIGKQITLHGGPYLPRQPLTLKTYPLDLPEGLLGMPEWTKFVLQAPQELLPVKLLVSREDPFLSFALVDPWLVDPTYNPVLSADDQAFFAGRSPADLQWLAVMRVESDPLEVHANLRAPLAVDLESGRARQVILSGSLWQPDTPLRIFDPSVQMESLLSDLADDEEQE